MRFQDLIGNERAVKALRSMIDGDALPHALLLHGEPGVPKLAAALATAQYLHCTERTGGDACGKCPACLQHQSMNHADTFFSYPIVKKSEHPKSEDFIEEWKAFLAACGEVEDYERWLTMLGNTNAQPMIYQSESESIIRKMSLAAYTSRHKVLIMWLPEKMKVECANKLLKMIEEPPADSIFILVSDNANAVLPTILSRTQRIEMSRPGTASVAQYLVRKLGASEQKALAASAPADGNVILAMQNLQSASETHEFHNRFAELMRMAYTRNIKALKTWSDGIADMKREKAQRFLAYATRMIRENYIFNLGIPQLNYLTAEEEAFSKNFARFITPLNAERLMTLFDDAARDIRGNGNAKIILFDTALKTTVCIKK